MSFDCTIERVGDATTVVPEGDIGVESIAPMRAILQQVIENASGGRVDVDMQAVTFLDSSGLGMLVAAHRAAAAKGVDLKLRDPGPVVAMVLQISALDTVLVRTPEGD